jgi:DNA-binding transcriptional LysR family regulator
LRSVTSKLQAVAVEGSFGRAAERLGFSQSAISQQIAAFERVLGEALFDRPGGPRRVALTPVGRLMLEYADAVLSRLRQAEDDIEKLRTGASGRLVVGTFQSVSVKILPLVIGRLRAEMPNLTIRAVESDENDELLGRLETGELDLTFVVNNETVDDIDAVELLVDPFVLLAPANSAAGPARLADLLSTPLIGQQPNSCQFVIDNSLRAKGVEPEYVYRSNDNGAVQAMVRAGLGHAILPLLAVDIDDPAVTVRELRPALAPRQISIVKRTGRTLLPAAHRFIELASEVCADVDAQRSQARVGAA